MADIWKIMADEALDQRERVTIERCKISTTANSMNDDVYVTFPNGPAPNKREIIDYWRPGIDDDGDPRYPKRGAVGVVFELDTGELWLMF